LRYESVRGGEGEKGAYYALAPAGKMATSVHAVAGPFLCSSGSLVRDFKIEKTEQRQGPGV